MNANSVLVFANGNLLATDWTAPYIEAASVIISADGGVHHLLAMGLKPHIMIGDLDSVSAKTVEALQSAGTLVLSYPPDKEQTDLELALLYAGKHFEGEILILGALGGRLDQTLANIYLLAHPALQARSVKIIEPNQSAWLVTQMATISGVRGDLISLIPLTDDVYITNTSGLRWPLKDERLQFGYTRGASNEMIDDIAHVGIRSGSVLCVHTKNSWRR